MQMISTRNVRRISNSEIQTWASCPRKWWLAWHRGLRLAREPRIGALWIGSREHEALAAIYTPGGRPLSDLPDLIVGLLADDRDRLEADFSHTAVYPELKKKFEAEAELQKIMLEGYVQWVQETGADDGLEVIAAEEIIEAPFYASPIYNTVIHLMGRLDVRVLRESDGKILFIDHKTVAAFIQRGALKRNQQMKMYRLLLQLSAAPDAQPGGAIYSQLRKVKRSARAVPPFYHRETLYFNRHEVETFDQHVTSRVTEVIQAEHLLAEGVSHHTVAPPRSSRECDWCPFAAMCDMLDDGSRAEDYLADHFVTDNPLSYYDTEGLTRHAIV